MSNWFLNPQGRPDDVGNRTIRRRIVFNQTNFVNGIPIGCIERGGVPLRAYAIKNTAFSAGATLTLGNAANPGAAAAPAAANTGPLAVPGSAMTGGSFYATNPAVAAQAAAQAVANPASFMGTGDTNATTAGEASVGNNTNPGGPLMGQEMVVNTPVYAYLAGTAPTSGDVTFILEYAPAYPWSDNFGDQFQ